MGCSATYSDADFYVRDSAYLRERGAPGLGLHASRHRKEGEVLLEYRGKELTPQEAHGKDHTYMFDVKDKAKKTVKVIDGRDCSISSLGRFVNDAQFIEHQNAVFVQRDFRVYLVAMRPIGADEEILASYGKGKMMEVVQE